jgi:hypothetical protein
VKQNTAFISKGCYEAYDTARMGSITLSEGLVFEDFLYTFSVFEGFLNTHFTLHRNANLVFLVHFFISYKIKTKDVS